MKQNQNLFDSLKKVFSGDIDVSEQTLQTYSRDASLFEIKPQVVVYPKNAEDVKSLVRWVNEENAKNHSLSLPILSITPRSAGTDMSGGAIGASIVMDCTRYINKIVSVSPDVAVVEPGCFYRDFDKATQKIYRFMPAFTASREINAMGGMVGNNSGGEKSIKYGKTENYIASLKIVLSDGNEYAVKPLNKLQLEQKMYADGFEGELYKKIHTLIINNLYIITSAKPNVSKNSAGYYLWNVYDKQTGIFDLCKLIVGSQGTFGILTEITFKLVPTENYSNILAVFLPSLDNVSQLVKEIIPFKPDSLETFDDYSLILAVKFFFDFFKQMGFWSAIKLGFQFIPEAWMILTGGVPKMILLVEFTGATKEEVKKKLEQVFNATKHFKYDIHIARSQAEADKYWHIRHESFNLLRKHVRGKRTAPFIDDIIVKPEYLPEFLPQIKKLLDEYKLEYTVQGHLGNGNFHIIPLMNLNSPFSADTILELSKKVYSLVKQYHGSITAEHNDGIIRTPFLREQFGDQIISLFEQTKKIFDPQNIFNPGKKVGGTFENIRKAIMKKN